MQKTITIKESSSGKSLKESRMKRAVETMKSISQVGFELHKNGEEKTLYCLRTLDLCFKFKTRFQSQRQRDLSLMV